MKQLFLLITLCVFVTSCVGTSKNLPFEGGVENITQADIALRYNKETKTLDLSRTGLKGDIDTTIIMDEATNLEIEVLDLSDNEITDFVYKALPNLKYLDLSNNELNNQSMRNLSKINLSTTFLNVSGNDVSEEFIKSVETKMQEHHPDVK